MLGRGFWQVKPADSRLYDAAKREVHWFSGVGTIFLFYDLRAASWVLGGAKQGQRVTIPWLRKFRPKYSNAFLPVRCLLSMSIQVYVRLGIANSASWAGVRLK
jgi:hypothetical protein